MSIEVCEYNISTGHLEVIATVEESAVDEYVSMVTARDSDHVIYLKGESNEVVHPD